MKKTHLQTLTEYGLTHIPPHACQYMLFSPGELLVQEGEPVSYFYIVISGRAKVCRNTPDGSSLILCWYVSEGVIGEVGLMAGLSNATTTVAAISEFSCIALDYHYCVEELTRNLTFSNKLGSEMAKKLVQRTNAFSAQAFYTGEQRVCSYILESAYRNVFSDMLTDVASSIGISYRHLLRLLKQLYRWHPGAARNRLFHSGRGSAEATILPERKYPKGGNNMKKLVVLEKIAAALNQAGILWCVGASALLYFKGKTDHFNDIDILVAEADAPRLKEILLPLGTLQPPNPHRQYKTRHFLEFTIDGVDVDVMGGFVIVSDGVTHDCSLLPEQITETISLNGETIPLHDLNLWRQYYEWMGRKDKVEMLNR